ncbi:amidase [Candidatus Geothermarchaeota archaeon]|nr:MAG: amidase [Candidatus Geothermarchaeota archaeon]
MRESILWKSGFKLRNMILNGDISAVDLLESILERIERINPDLNAVVTLNEDARKEAEEADKLAKKGVEKPLLGVPLTIKDNICTRGLKTTYGSILYKDFIPGEDAIVVERVREAGAVIIGKTNLPEFGLVAITDNPLFGPTRNPWDRERTPGGSSGGSAVAVATGLGPISIGNDGGGSIRIPASFCGVYGFKPSNGVVPNYPSLPLFIGLATDGPITRYVIDAGLIMDVISGPDYHDKSTYGIPKMKFLDELNKTVEDAKIAYSPDLGYATVDPEIEEKVREAAFRFSEFGFEVEEIRLDIPNLENELTLKVIAEIYTFFRDRLEEWKMVAFKPYLTFLTMAEYITFSDYIRIMDKSNELWLKMMGLFKSYDYLVTPTVAITAFKIEDGMGPDSIAGKPIGPIGWMPFTYPFNFTGQPAASIPVGLDKNGLPIGMQVVGRPYDDIGVLRLSKLYEERYSWHSLKPPI